MANLKGGTTIGGHKAWHSGNDGAGSGLDADKLDGAELSDIQSEIASDIATHVSDANAHHDESHTVASHSDTSVTGTQLNADHSKLATIEAGSTGDLTATEILTLLKTVDGAGSDLDADKLDGHDTLYFATSDHTHGMNDLYDVGISGLSLGDVLQWTQVGWINTHRADSGFALDSHNHDADYLGLTAKAADSDKVDGINGASLLRSDVSDIFSGTTLTLNTNVVFNSNSGANYFAITRTGSMAKEWVKHTLHDTKYGIHYDNDEATGIIEWHIDNADTEIGGGLDANNTYMTLYGESSDPRLDIAGHRVWTAGTDGSGSGLDADLLDGQEYINMVIDWENYADGAVTTHTSNENAHHNKLHTLASHTDTTVTGAELNADHSKLAAIEVGATADQTAAEILTAIKTVDGSGSGLDADTVDGLEASALSLSGHTHASLINGTAGLSVSNNNEANFSSNIDQLYIGWRTINTAISAYKFFRGESSITSFADIYCRDLYEDDVKLENKYLGISAKATDSELLDGIDSVNYARTDIAEAFASGITAASFTANSKSSTGALVLKSGDQNNTPDDYVQIAFGYNGTDDYQNYIVTRHSNLPVFSAIEFYTSDGTQAGAYPTNAVMGLSVVGGGIRLPTGMMVNEFSADETLAGDSMNAVPTESAVKAYVDNSIHDESHTIASHSDTTVTGAELNTDHSKLSGIESGATTDQTAAEILTAIKTVDGTGSGLDADLLDGQEYINMVIDWENYTDSAISTHSGNANVHHSESHTIASHSDTTVTGAELNADHSKLAGIEASATADQTAAEIITAIKTVDGAGSGLDADLLDGNEASAFAISGHSHTLDGLSDVATFSPGWGEIIQFRQPQGWTNATFAEAGISATNHNHDSIYTKLTGSNLTGSYLWADDQDYKGIYWGAKFEDAEVHSGTWAYIRQSTAAGQLEIGSDDKISFYETDSRVLAAEISTNNKTLDVKGYIMENGVSLASKYLGITAKASDSDLLDGITGSAYEHIDQKGVVNGYAGLGSDGKVPLTQIPDTARQQTYVVIDVAARDALTGLIAGERVYITSTGDTDIWDGDSWETVADADWQNVNLDWANIINGPSTTPTQIDDNHTKLGGIESGATADQTAAEILTAIKTVDGAGSGLDADSIDGIEGADIMQKTGGTFTGTLTVPSNFTVQPASAADHGGEIVLEGDATYAYTDWHIDSYLNQMRISDGTTVWFYVNDNGEIRTNGETIWHSGNDGIGSGLNADLLDGQEYVSMVIDWENYADSAVSTHTGNANAHHSASHTVASHSDTTVTGAELNADHIKLSGIETGATADQTAAEILTAIKTVDGIGSGLDADLLDGIDSGSFLRSDTEDTFTANTMFGYDGAGHSYALKFQGVSGSGGEFAIRANGEGLEIFEPEDGDKRWLYIADDVSGSTDILLGTSGHKVWHAGNDGIGSGLDADMLDGNEASAFAISDHSHTLDGLSDVATFTPGWGEIIQFRQPQGWTNATLAEAGIADIYHDHDADYLGLTAKAADSDKLDGYDSSAFLSSASTSTQTVAGSSMKIVKSDETTKYCSMDYNETTNCLEFNFV